MITGAATESELDWFRFLDGRLRSAVEAAVADGNDPDDALRGLYISDEQALALAATGAGPDPSALGTGAAVRLAEACTRLKLDALDSAVLALCAAPELQPRSGRLYAYLQDDVTRRLASPRLAAELLTGDGVEPEDVYACFSPGAPLGRRGALRLLPGEPHIPLADRSAKVADRLAGFLLGAGGLGDGGLGDGSSGPRLRRVDPDPLVARAHTVAELSLLLASDVRLPLVVCGPDAATVLATASGGPLILLSVGELEQPDALTDARLAATLTGARLCLDGLGDLTPVQRARLLRTVDESPDRLVLIAARLADATVLSERTAMTVAVPYPEFGDRGHAWTALTGAPHTEAVAAKFRLSIMQIRAGAEVALIAARGHGEPTPGAADLDLGARRASSSPVGELATQLRPGFSWSDLVLPERQLDLLSSISAYLLYRDRVLSEWGYAETVSRTQGLKVLFAGESGTGKTMAAQVIGAELGLELFRIDLATIVSKYIGETEKNLERIFTAADGSNAILFFDEADALFGKRSEVSDSHDRYANIEVAYLLQRMEEYPGAVILATNFRSNIDDAFVRRLDFVIDFPFPEPPDRRRIWERVLPSAAPLAADLDLDFLANQFKLSGGAIRNCSLTAAFRAAEEGSEIAMRHLVRAVAQEYGKQGRLTLEVDFERFHSVVREGGG